MATTEAVAERQHHLEQLSAQAAEGLGLRAEIDELFGDGVELVAQESLSGIDAVVEDVEAVVEAVDAGI